MTLRRLTIYVLSMLIMGCSSVPQNTNTSLSKEESEKYLVSNRIVENDDNMIVLMSFSGGGTRAAALSYGVMKGLHDYTYEHNNQHYRLIEHVNAISSVSGGSFTSSYYGLYGDEMFDHFEERFLYKDVTQSLVDQIMSPKHWFSNEARSVVAAEYYKKYIFEDKTFGDIKNDGPMIIINATDLSTGVRFSFTQEYFDIICSDINEYSLHNAVTASSAVPLIFSPVLLENYDTCTGHDFLSTQAQQSNRLSTENLLSRYQDKTKYQYLHLVDGGISDNLGLHGLYDLVTTKQFGVAQHSQSIKTIVIVSVDAAVKPDWNIGTNSKEPSISNMIGSLSDVQIHRYNDLSKTYLNMVLEQWESQEAGRKFIFLDINLSNAPQQEAVQSIPTDFNLTDEQVDMLIQHGYLQIVENHLLSDFLENQLSRKDTNRKL